MQAKLSFSAQNSDVGIQKVNRLNLKKFLPRSYE